MQIFRIFLIFYTSSKNSQSLSFTSNSANPVLKNPCSLKHLLIVKFSYKENTVRNCCRNNGHFLFCARPFALHRQQPEKDKQKVDFPPWKNFCWRPCMQAGNTVCNYGTHYHLVLSHKTHRKQGICYVTIANCYITKTFAAGNKYPDVKVTRGTKKVGQACSTQCCMIYWLCEPSFRRKKQLPLH